MQKVTGEESGDWEMFYFLSSPLNRFKIKNYDHAYKLVFEYIETFYNTVRLHSHCEYLSPNEYEDVYKQKLDKIERLAG